MVRYEFFCYVHFYGMIMSEIGLFPDVFSPAVEVLLLCRRRGVICSQSDS